PRLAHRRGAAGEDCARYQTGNRAESKNWYRLLFARPHVLSDARVNSALVQLIGLSYTGLVQGQLSSEPFALPWFLHPGIEGQSPGIMVHIPFGAVVFPLPTVSVILRMAVCPSW